MRLSIFDIDKFSESLPEVTTNKIFEGGKISKSGLFSQQIFGPIKSYRCACPRSVYRGQHSDEKKCQVCDVDITSSEERRKRMAKIALPFEVLNPIFYYLVLNAKPSKKRTLDNILFFKIKYVLNADNTLTKLTDIDNPDMSTLNILYGLDGAIKLIKLLAANSSNQEFKFINKHFDKITIKNVIVIPPDFRNFTKMSTGSHMTDTINQHYSELLMRVAHINKMIVEITPDQDIYKTYYRSIQTYVLNIYDHIFNKLSKKKGLIRSNLLGKRVDFSGRAVISPCPTLNINECRIPYLIVLEILKPQLTSYLVNKRLYKRYNQASSVIDECIRSNNPMLFETVREFCKDKICILNRQPTLHRMSILAFKLDIHLGNTIQLAPMVCPAYNADFDGDCMAIYIPVTDISFKDTHKKLGIWNNLLSPTDATIVPRPNQDIILGIYSATKDSNGKLYDYKGEKLTIGRKKFNECLPENYNVVNKPIGKSEIIKILNEIALNYDSNTTMKTLDNIKHLGFELSTQHGYTLSIDDLYNNSLIEIANKLDENNVSENLKTINSNEAVQKIIKSLPFYIFIESGARGSMDQVKQLILSRGYVADANNKVKTNLIRSSLVAGLNQKEYFNSCWGTRKGLLDTALSTGTSGYLTRQLIYTSVNMELDDIEDCGSTEYLTVNVPSDPIEAEPFLKSILWRYHKVGDHLKLITLNNCMELAGKRLKLRSPIYCKSKNICKKCYGNLHKLLHSDQIGIVATQAIGERTTQLVLRTFHIGGVVQADSDGDENKDIISGMTVVNKLFHNPSAILNTNNPNNLVLKLQNVFGEYGSIHLVHYEVIVSAMMWNKSHIWRTSKNRNNQNYEFVSILQVPSRSSWLLACAFSRLKSKIIDGLINDRVDAPSSISKLFRY